MAAITPCATGAQFLWACNFTSQAYCEAEVRYHLRAEIELRRKNTGACMGRLKLTTGEAQWYFLLRAKAIKAGVRLHMAQSHRQAEANGRYWISEPHRPAQPLASFACLADAENFITNIHEGNS